MSRNRTDTRQCSRARLAVARAALGACLLGAAACGPEPYEGPYRHVILISMDTTRADHLSCYGNPSVKTPNLDRVASEGVLFRDVTTAAPTTLASHTSIMTGTYPHKHGIVRNGFTVHDRNEMLAEILAGQGFYTAAFLGSWALESLFGFDQGFDWFDETFDIEFHSTTFDQDQRRAAQVTDAVLAHVDQAQVKAQERLFLFVHYFDAHTPYSPPAPFDSMYTREGGPASSSLVEVDQAVSQHTRALGEPVAPRVSTGMTRGLLEKAHGEARGFDRDLAALYAGEISYMDREIGRLLDALRERGILDETLLVITADHGETFWEHGDFWNHGLWVYDTTVRVPLIVRLPQELQARQVDLAVSTVDILPTLLELLEIEPPARCDGVSLAPVLAGGALERGPIFSEATQPWKGPSSDRLWANETNPRCVREGSLKYVRASYLDVEQLFDLAQDPGERFNLAHEGGEQSALETLRGKLEAWMGEANPLPGRFDPSQMQRLRQRAATRKEVSERLKRFGYAGLGGEEEDEGEGEKPEDDQR